MAVFEAGMAAADNSVNSKSRSPPHKAERKAHARTAHCIVPQVAGELAERVTNALHPQVRLLTRAAPAAGSACSAEGALFLGDAVVRGPGAVGCFLRGASGDLDELMRELMSTEGRCPAGH